MADIEYWIQIENHAWDLAPHNIDRMHGMTMEEMGFPAPVVKALTSPETGVVLHDLTGASLNADGKKLLDAAVDWAEGP